MANTMTFAAEAFSHILVARVVSYLRTRTAKGAVTHDELMGLLMGENEHRVPAPSQVLERETQPPVPETQPPVPETQPSVPAPAPACKGIILGKPCTREAVKGKELCKQCSLNHAKKERESKKKETQPEPTPLVPTQVAPPSQPESTQPAPKPTQPLVVVDASKNLFRNVRTNWLIYETGTESQVVGVMHGEDTVPLTQTEREAALRSGYTVPTTSEDPEATQNDSLIPTQLATQESAPAPAPAPVQNIRKTKSKTLPPPPVLPIPTSDIASTLPM
jgi:hypothetical protein